MRKENGLLSSDEEKEWENEENEENRRRTILIRSLRQELIDMLNEVKKRRCRNVFDVEKCKEKLNKWEDSY